MKRNKAINKKNNFSCHSGLSGILPILIFKRLQDGFPTSQNDKTTKSFYFKSLIVYLIAILLFFINSVSLLSQTSQFEREELALSAYTGLCAGFSNVNFHSFQGAADCGLFQNGSGSGFSAMFAVERKLNPYWFVSLGFAYIDRGSELSLESGFHSRDLSTNQPIIVETKNSITTELSYFEIHPEVKFLVLSNLISGPLKFTAGARLFFPMKSTFSQTEKIVSPDIAVFIIDGKRVQERQIASGNIETINSTGFGVSAGIENALNAGKYLHIIQRIMFDYNISNTVSDTDWKTYSLRFELGLRFSITSFNMASPLKP